MTEATGPAAAGEGSGRSMILVPLVVRESFIAEAAAVAFGIGGSFEAWAFTGRRVSGEPAILLAGDIPVEEWALSKLQKSVIEQMVFASFAAAHEGHSGQPPYDGVQQGADPPDVSAVKGGLPVGIELRQFADQGRRDAATRLGLVADAVDKRATRFPPLAGWRVQIYAEDLGSPDFRGGHADEVVDLMETMDPGAHSVRVPDATAAGAGMPEQLYPAAPLVTSRGTRLEAVRTEAVPMTTRFASRHGFELALAHSSESTRDELLAKLQAVIDSKDAPGSDEVLITFGAPDATGFRWPVERLVYQMIVAGGVPPMRARHLRRAYIYEWQGTFAEVPLDPNTSP